MKICYIIGSLFAILTTYIILKVYYPDYDQAIDVDYRRNLPPRNSVLNIYQRKYNIDLYKTNRRITSNLKLSFLIISGGRCNYLVDTINAIMSHKIDDHIKYQYDYFLSIEGGESNYDCHNLMSSKYSNFFQDIFIHNHTTISSNPHTKIANHHKFAVEKIYKILNYDVGFICEDDLVIKGDFFTYLNHFIPYLLNDDSLFAINTMNFHSHHFFSYDERNFYRMEGFNGWGFLVEGNRYRDFLERYFLDEDLSWDYLLMTYLRDKDQHSIYPELPRIKHIGVSGVTAWQYSNTRNDEYKYCESDEGKYIGFHYYLYQQNYKMMVIDLLRHSTEYPLKSFPRAYNSRSITTLIFNDYLRYDDTGTLLVKYKVFYRYFPYYYGVVILQNQFRYPMLLYNQFVSPLCSKSIFYRENLVYLVGHVDQSCKNVCKMNDMTCKPKNIISATRCSLLREYFSCKFCASHTDGAPGYLEVDKIGPHHGFCINFMPEINNPSCEYHEESLTPLCVCERWSN